MEIKNINMKDLTPDERGIVSSFTALLRLRASKKEARDMYNAELRAAARAAGASEKEIAKMPRQESTYIHGVSTYKQYIDESLRFYRWAKATHEDVRKVRYARRYAYEYIQWQIEKGMAASTIAKRTSALAKLYRCHSWDIHDNRPPRLSADFTRSRGYNETQYSKDWKKYGPIVELCRTTGVRECELEHLTPECFHAKPDGRIWLHLDGKHQNTKGGKTRDVVIIDENQARIKEILSTLPPKTLICPNAPSHLDVHGIRALYAADYYAAIARDIAAIPKSERFKLTHPRKDTRHPGHVYTTAPAVYRRKSDGKCFDRRALSIVSLSLGHGREDVVVLNYLR